MYVLAAAAPFFRIVVSAKPAIFRIIDSLISSTSDIFLRRRSAVHVSLSGQKFSRGEWAANTYIYVDT
jgi:hypothetical protein